MIIEFILILTPFIVAGIYFLIKYLKSNKEERKDNFISTTWDEGCKLIFGMTAIVAYITVLATSITPICTFTNLNYCKEQKEKKREDLIDDLLYFKNNKNSSYEDYKSLKQDVSKFNYEIEKAKNYNIWWTDFIIADYSYKDLKPIDLNSTLFTNCC